MDEALPSSTKFSEPPQSKIGTSVLPNPVNCVLKLGSQNVEQLEKLLLNTEYLNSINDLILTHTEIQNLPTNFTVNLRNLSRLNLEKNKLENLPENMTNIVKLQYLNVSYNCLKILSEDIGMLTNLQTLRLESNSLVELSDICYLINLQQLNVANNSLRILPKDIGNLVKLEMLDVSGNLLEELPDSMCQLTNLSYFNASLNKLAYLSEDFTHLNKLTTLDLSHNSMCEIPYCLYTGLPNVSVLDLSYNNIDNFSDTPNCVSKLRRLKLDHNNFLNLPRWIFRDTCKHLLELSISHNNYMNGVNNGVFFSASGLKNLDLSDCSLATTSVGFLRGLQKLEYLNMGNKVDVCLKQKTNTGNTFWDLPISELKNSNCLRSMKLCNVGLAALPEEIIQLNTLQHMDLSSNDLTWLPDAFCDLIQLISCQLSNNNLVLLPMQFGKLRSLKELRLNGNKLHSLPESMARLEQLEYLDLYSNNFEEVPVILKNLANLKCLDLEYNSFDPLNSLKNDNFKDRYICMKCSIRSQLSGFSQSRVDCQRPPLDCETYSSADETNSSIFSEEIERESYPEGNHHTPNIIREEEENWDSIDEVNDNFDPLVFPPTPQKKSQQQRALLVMESLASSADNFCPADIHVPPVKTWNKLKYVPAMSFQTVEGQFDDSSLG